MLTSVLERLWRDGGFGIDVELCGYVQSMHAFLPMKHFAHLEIYHCPDTFIWDDIKFNNKGGIYKPFLEQLWLANEC